MDNEIQYCNFEYLEFFYEQLVVVIQSKDLSNQVLVYVQLIQLFS